MDVFNIIKKFKILFFDVFWELPKLPEDQNKHSS